MKRITHSYLGAFLALVLALTGQSMAVARGMPDAAGTIVLCTGTGPMVVSVDDQGQLVGPQHLCPDIAAALFACAAAPTLVLLRPQGRIEVLRPLEQVAAVSLGRGRATARGPPATV